MSAEGPVFRRILLKLSGEALMGRYDFGIDPETLNRLADETAALAKQGIQVALVIGGGNIFRGAGLAQGGMNRVTGDHMGMLATVMNALAFQDRLLKIGMDCRVMSALSMTDVCENYSQREALRHLEAGRVVIFAAGTGNPYFTTDSAASLRAIEIQADVLIKATKVDGVYDADPMKHPEAKRYDSLDFDDVLSQKLAVMDATAIVLCRDNRIPLRVMNIFDAGALERLAAGDNVGTLVN